MIYDTKQRKFICTSCFGKEKPCVTYSQKQEVHNGSDYVKEPDGTTLMLYVDPSYCPFDDHTGVPDWKIEKRETKENEREDR